MKQVKWREWLCNIVFKKYDNGRVALVLVDSRDNCPVGTATINLPSQLLDEDEVFIKEYTENTGVLQALVEAGVVEKTEEQFEPPMHTGVVRCKLLITADD